MAGWILLLGVGAGLVGYVAAAALAAHRLTQPRRRMPLFEPSEVGLACEDIWFRARGEPLNIAAWHLPAPDAARAVIIAHGVGGCRGREFITSSRDLVEHLLARGITILMVDLRGHGESDAARMTYGDRERRDLLGAVDWLLARGYAPGAIGVLGLSMGGVAGIGAAAEDAAIGALVVDSACADFPEMMRSHFRRYSRLPPILLTGAIAIGRALLGIDLGELRPARTLRQIEHLPTLIIHAEGDPVVPVSHAQELALAGGADLWITKAEVHLGSYSLAPHAYGQRVAEFFLRMLLRRAGRPAAQRVAARPALGELPPALLRGAAEGDLARPGSRATDPALRPE